MYESILRPWLFRLDPETAHHVALRACRVGSWIPGATSLARHACTPAADELTLELAGIDFPNPIGLAAGWDKNAIAVRMLESLGFGFTEIGSISARPSIGNPKPRLFRLPQHQAIVVNYGLPNDGAKIIAKRLAGHRPRIPLGVNVVTTNHGPNAAACSADEIFADYATSVSLVQEHTSYLTLNLSCPNAKDGQDFFAQPGHIGELLARLADVPIDVPVFLKVPPTDSPSQHDRWLSESEPFGFVRGFMFNLSPGKPKWLDMPTRSGTLESMPGAVAGAPVARHMNQCIAALYSRMDRERYAIIGGGGIFTADDAWTKIQLGASLVQIYTSLIYQGPSVIRRVHEGLLQKLRQHGHRNITEAIGTGSL